MILKAGDIYIGKHSGEKLTVREIYLEDDTVSFNYNHSGAVEIISIATFHMWFKPLDNESDLPIGLSKCNHTTGLVKYHGITEAYMFCEHCNYKTYNINL